MKLYDKLIGYCDLIPYALIAVFVRIIVAHTFFISGQTKIEGPTIGGPLLGLDLSFQIPTAIRDATFILFENDYKIPLLSPNFAAYLATFAEHILPTLLFLGLFGRFSALALLGMTLVIQFFVYPDAWWTAHSYWCGLLLVIIARGPGAFSLDQLFWKRN